MADLERVWSSTLLIMPTKRSRLKVGNVLRCLQLKTELYSLHYEHNDQFKVEKRNWTKENLKSRMLFTMVLKIVFYPMMNSLCHQIMNSLMILGVCGL